LFKGIGRLCPDCEAEVCEKIAKGRKIFNQHSFEASIKYDADKARYECTNRDGFWVSYNGENWIQAESIPVKGKPNPVLETGTDTVELSNEFKHDDYILPQLEAQLYAQSLESPWGDLPPTQQKIHELMGAMKDLLLYKNQKYGDSAINPKKIFYKGDSTNSILIRLDDKIGRVMSNTEEKPRINDVCDIIGYCTLLLISMGVTAEDIAKFKD
jgi:hypothetical protein